MQEGVMDLGIAVHVQEPIAFPVDIGEFSNDIALNARMSTHVLDLELERIQLQALAGFRQGSEGGEDALQMVVPEALLDTARVDNSIAPLEARIEPQGRGSPIPFIKLVDIR